MPKVALAIIAKDEVEQINKIVELYSDYFDEIAIALDTPVEDALIKMDKLKVHRYEWQDDFAHKRNFLAGKIESEYYLRMDTDDELVNPDVIPKIVENMANENIDVVYCQYIYSRDDDGNCNAMHWRETVIRKSENCYWKKRVHENIFIDDMALFKGVKEPTLKILHKIDKDHAEKSAQRNFDILMREWKEDREKTDPRTLAYIGRMLMGNGQWDKAVFFLRLLVDRSGWDDDRYFAYVHMAHCELQMGKTQVAIAACNEAIAINTEYPDAYLCLAEIYLSIGDNDKSIHWGAIGLSKPVPDTMMVTDPSIYSVRAKMNMAMALLAKGDIKTAKAYYDHVYRIAPSNEFIAAQKELFQEAYENSEYFERLAWMAVYLREKDANRLRDLVASIPKNMMRDERVHGLRNSILPPKKWTDDSIAIFCGRSWETWADPSVIRGIGGSEEAVIYLSRELVKLGFKVVVFNDCGDLAGTYNNVEYRPYYEFNPNDSFNTVIAWRGDIFGPKLKAKKKIVWLHDVPMPDQFRGDLHFDKIIVLSKFHKSLLPKNIPEDKILVSSNGINLADFDVEVKERNPYRLIHTSSYDRGIQHLLLEWGKVKKAVPKAELHLFYGWDTYDKMVQDGMRSPEFREKMTALMQQDGVFEHGRVGHKKLVKEFKKSGVYVYPSHFEEISCISAMKAQACGCVPFVTDYAALKETVKSGVFIGGSCSDKDVAKKYVNTLIDFLGSPDRQESIRKEVERHKNEFGWDRVALQWAKELL